MRTLRDPFAKMQNLRDDWKRRRAHQYKQKTPNSGVKRKQAGQPAPPMIFEPHISHGETNNDT